MGLWFKQLSFVWHSQSNLWGYCGVNVVVFELRLLKYGLIWDLKNAMFVFNKNIFNTVQNKVKGMFEISLEAVRCNVA